MKNEFDKLPLWAWILIAVFLLSQSTWLFLDARKRGNMYWFWGIWGITSVPGPLLVYLLFARKIHQNWFKQKKLPK
ncbi:Negative regulatory protein YxlD [compost metagenome]